MNETVNEWLAKAEGDYWSAKRELEASEHPNYDAACFHAQQCVEKTMKAALIRCGVVPPRTHDLLELYAMLTRHYPELHWHVEDLRFLTLAAVEFRYPGSSADADDASEAFEICARLRQALLGRLE